MRIGYGKSIITPTSGVHRLAGYLRRKEPSMCIFDDIYVKTLLLETIEDNLLVLVSVDLLAIDNNMLEDMRKISKGLIGNSHVVITATHTHSAPISLFKDMLPGMGMAEFDPEYYEHFLSMFERSLLNSYEKLGKGECYSTTITVSGVATNRNDPNTPIDDKAVVVKCITGDLKVGLLNYGVHPTVLGPSNKCVSRDLAGAIEDSLRNNTGIEFVFINGAAADVSTRFTRIEQSYSEVLRLGSLFANSITRSLGQVHWRKLVDAPIAVKKESLTMSVDSEKFYRIARKLYIERKLGGVVGKLPGLKRVVESIEEAIEASQLVVEKLGDIKEISIEVSSYLIGRVLGLIALPGEALSKISMECREIAGIDTVFAGYANGYYGYFSDKAVVNTYEDVMTLFTHGDVGKLYDLIKKHCSWLNDMSRSL
ncbi:MAG: neutral/alkaline non-lysosomal ceramidase N-terminal domain-containing protein [Desulfurococcaceae archaeon]